MLFCLNGQYVVAGGHTSGFVPTPTAEYYDEGRWHTVPTVYSHDLGFGIATTTGQVLMASGTEKELGIGQTFTLELYDPATHQFKGYGCMEQKRCFATALEVDSGRVVISGNWYALDGIEMFDGSRQNSLVKDVAQQRSMPYILRTAKDNAIIFSSKDTKGNDIDSIIVDRLKGEAFTVPLFQTWRPFNNLVALRNAECFIGDEAKGIYTNLILVVNAEGQVAVARCEGEQFELLPTDGPIPMKSRWGRINYTSFLVADRRAARAYLTGFGEDDHRVYVVSIDYRATPATLTLHYGQPQDSVPVASTMLTPDGNLLLAGGLLPPYSNFEPTSTVVLLRLASPSQPVHESHAWVWQLLVLCALAALAVAAAAVAIIRYVLKRRRTKALSMDEEETETVDPLSPTDNAQLMKRIVKLMDERKPYLNSELKLADVAKLLDTNRAYISTCINSEKGYTFNQYINYYRIEYAKQLIINHPRKKINEVWSESGFSNETTFFRTFKTMTGMTPSEWKTEIDEHREA